MNIDYLENTKVIELAVVKNYTAIDGEKLAIRFNKFTAIRKDISDATMGELVGHVEVVYPVAGLNVTLTLEVHQGFSSDFEQKSGVFKLPFVEVPVYIVDLEFEVYCNSISNDFIVEEEKPAQCRCGGLLVPYYEEYPSHTYCSNFCED